MQLGDKLALPSFLIIEGHINDAIIVGRPFDVRRNERANAIGAELADEEAHLENHVLARARRGIGGRHAGRQKPRTQLAQIIGDLEGKTVGVACFFPEIP